MACAAAHMFVYNATLCACDPGYFLFTNSTGGSNGSSTSTSCVSLPRGGDGFGDWQVGSVGASKNQSFYFLTPVLSLDVVRRLTQSQAVLLWVALATLLSWFAFCAAARFAGQDPARHKKLFGARFWVSRLDCIFDNNHYANDQQVLRKRKTELGGMFSVATVILFLGLATVLLYQAIHRRNAEVHRVKPANAPDLLDFVNDLEFHITTISSMSCAQVVAPSTIAMGTPGFMDFRVLPLSTLLTYTCQNTSEGPSITLKCNGCRIPPRDHYVSWQFVDLPRQPAAAIGFQFNLTAKEHGDDKDMSFVSGTLSSDNYVDAKLKTFRGPDSNVLKIQLFPQIYNNHRGLKLLQPLVQDFTQGSTLSDLSSLNASLQNPRDGVINTTLYISYLSDYIVEISNENVLGPVSILASIGGLYAFSVAIFLCLMAQCEGRIKKLRDEDTRMLNILSKQRAQRNWNKVRKFVMYTWGPSNLDPTDRSGKWPEGSVMDSLHGSFHKRRKPIRRGASNGSKPNKPGDMVPHHAVEIERVGEIQQSSNSR
ncbi:hypothetical protein BDA96_03G114100 [Sorghum bicolor]|uniref:Uncharacterized protein n=2 Tax=Sorghum bicolor TaxID=4558 RepID=A0A921RAQ1_SORBI|nr:uncharacterized protein LOC8072383 isoform X2 [Sorghum bicolor]XP_021313442.1 uncharacterized protein LOC8072383 isoform X2 [Sorghum bicolor]EES02670.1 hypothetical protein SORBI_3003G109700 [Sorghum bicolor]KAG0537044.1 hypothetical protein BDA96_03G114100 [Sorghum bicolor]KAG0537045.1 hypothetical protein BDA96_03G114100 [Sorghum bicolor]|eukprot:XP_021313441.1 uncharacterized protein LOC8072383 isoform X2 [Sorghum bicolor]